MSKTPSPLAGGGVLAYGWGMTNFNDPFVRPGDEERRLAEKRAARSSVRRPGVTRKTTLPRPSNGFAVAGVAFLVIFLLLGIAVFIWALVTFITMVISGVTEGWNAGSITWAIISGIVLAGMIFSRSGSKS